jgi:hypothetical protein
MVLFFDKQDSMVLLNKCLRCGVDMGELTMEEDYLGKEDYSPVDPDDWDA